MKKGKMVSFLVTLKKLIVLYNEEFHNLYSPPNAIRAVISRTMWVVFAACKGEEKCIHFSAKA
jgi:hypothetical protein